MSQARSQCPDEHALAALLDGGVPVDADPALVEHVAGCDECRRLIGGLGRVVDAPLPRVPDALLARAAARRTVGLDLGGSRWWQAAAAAACLLAAAGLWRGTWPHRAAGVTGVSVPAATVAFDDVRGTGPTEPPRMLEPLPNATVGAAPVLFRWTPVEGAMQYHVQVLTSGGDVVWSETTAETSIRFEQRLEGESRQYYAWVAAQLPDGRRLQSTVVRLTGRMR